MGITIQQQNIQTKKQSISIIDETINVTNRISKGVKTKNKFRLRKTLVDEQLLQNYFVFENSARAENELTTYKVNSTVEGKFSSSQLKVTQSTITTTMSSMVESNECNHEYSTIQEENSIVKENQDNLNLLLFLLLINTRTTESTQE